LISSLLPAGRGKGVLSSAQSQREIRWTPDGVAWGQGPMRNHLRHEALTRWFSTVVGLMQQADERQLPF
jgi:hypothetical protein